MVSKNGTSHPSKSRLPESHPTPPKLSAVDEKYLASYLQKLQHVRDRVIGVASGYDTGAIIHGPGGAGKSYTVIDELRTLGAYYRLSNSRMTGRGLFDTLAKYPDAIHVIEDAESMLRDATAIGVLRSALWASDGGNGQKDRWITWTAFGHQLEVLFEGGIIMILNRALADDPEMQALATRVPLALIDPSDNEIQAMMRSISTKPYQHLDRNGLLHVMSPNQCSEVCEYIIAQSGRLHHPMDLRLLVHGFHDFIQWDASDAANHWHDLVLSRIRDRPTTTTATTSRPMIGSRSERIAQELAIVRQIVAATSDTDEQVKRWHDETGKSRATWFRRRSEIRK